MTIEPTAGAEPDRPGGATGRGDGKRKSVLLRLDPAVHHALAQWASDDLRSLNAHIELLLRDALHRAGRGVRAAPLRGRGRPPKSAGE